MSFTAKYIPYKDTGAFSQMVLDYLGDAVRLRPFHNGHYGIDGIRKNIESRNGFFVNRSLLVDALRKQYRSTETSALVKANIDSLSLANTYTICTAHQPNIFTGHLYFIYKILHAIKLADELNTAIPEQHFVPVYYMGSEDADLDELGTVMVNGKEYKWETSQKGAVGRMLVDQAFIGLINELEGQLSVEQYGTEILSLVRKCYSINKTIEQATFELVNTLFAEFGLVIFLPDSASLKTAFVPVIKKELKERFSNKLVKETIEALPQEYKVQVYGREINMFYLKGDLRERIEAKDGGYTVLNTPLFFTEDEMDIEISQHPERFSPNVILRPVYQELVLPNVAFIGGGGELAYWLELKKVFEAVSVTFPVLVLRNSFMIIPADVARKISAMGMQPEDFFRPANDIFALLVKKESSLDLHLEAEKESMTGLYEKMQDTATAVDFTLQRHVEALKVQALKKIDKLEKKIFRAEKKKFEIQLIQAGKIKEALFPGGPLQERIDNLLPYYSRWGRGIMLKLLDNSGGFEQQFCILEEQP